MEKNNLIDCSFLQVTINSNKLMQILQKISKQMNQHSTQIRILRQTIPTIKQSLFTTLQTSEARMRFQGEKNVLKLKQQLTLVKASLTHYELQLSKFNINSQKKFKEKQGQIQMLIQQKKRIQSIINLYEQDRIQNYKRINEQLSSAKQSIQKVQTQICQNDSKIDDKFQMMFIKFQSMIKRNHSNSRINSDFNQSNNLLVKKKRNSTTLKKHADQQNKQFKSSGMSNISNWASFSTKIAEFQKKYQQMAQNPPCTNKILYSKLHTSKQLESQYHIDSQVLDQQNIGSQKAGLQNIGHFMKMYNSQIQKIINQLKNKIIIQQQKLGITARKLQKSVQTQVQLKMHLQKLQQKKPNDQVLEILRNQIKKVHIQISQELQKRLHKEVFDREKSKLYQKISILQQNLIQKADKGDMKKAFLFMEQKIKQIIILIASEQSQQKNGAIRKMQAKCLSCDKGLQTQNTTPNRLASPLTSRQNQINVRTITRKIRSRIQTNSQNSSLNM